VSPAFAAMACQQVMFHKFHEGDFLLWLKAVTKFQNKLHHLYFQFAL